MIHRRKLFAGMILFLGGIATLTAYVMITHAAPAEKFAEVTEGMTEAEVVALLGTPEATETSLSKKTYLYGEGLHHLQWCTMDVIFSPEGKVVAKIHDH